MKNTLLIVIMLFTLSITAQNNTETIFKEYSKQTIVFENPKIKEYSEKFANLFNDFCMEKLSGIEYAKKLNLLNRIYKGYFVAISEKDKTNLGVIQNIVQADGNNYIKKRNLEKAKAYAKLELAIKNKKLQEEVNNAKIIFEDKYFEKFANQAQELSIKQCATNISQEDYHTESLKLRKKYKRAIKRASKSDTDNLMLLNKKSFLKCIDYTIDKQYSSL